MIAEIIPKINPDTLCTLILRLRVSIKFLSGTAMHHSAGADV